MNDLFLLKIIKFIFAVSLCFVALLLPYGPRMHFTKILAFLIHLPYLAFGKITHYLFKKLKINPDDVIWR